MKKLLQFFSQWTTSWKHFPVAYVCLFVITVLLILITCNYLGFDTNDHVEKIIIGCGMAFLLSLYSALWKLHQGNQEGQTPSKTIQKTFLLGQIVSLLLGGGYYGLLEFISIEYDAEGFLLFRIIPLLIAGIPLLISRFYRKKEAKIRLHWNHIFESVFLGLIAGGIIRGGLAGATWSLEELFDLSISWRRYTSVGIFSMIFLVGSFIFTYYLLLLKQPTEEISPSRLRKIFGCYIILPLVLIYLAIFFAYGVKILITGDWPKGVIVRLGFAYFLSGMVSYYLTYPEEKKVYHVLHTVLFGSFFFVALMMTGAICLRIQQYGVTANRAFICAFILFLILFSVFSLVKPHKRLQSFITLFIGVAFLCVYQPLNVHQISFLSQKGRIVNILEENSISLPLHKDSLTSLTGEDATIMQDVLNDFWWDYPKDKRIHELIDEECISQKKGNNTYEEDNSYLHKNTLFQCLGLSMEKESYRSEYFYLGNGRIKTNGIDVQGFSRVYSLDASVHNNIAKFEIVIDGDTLTKTVDLQPYAEDFYQQYQQESKHGVKSLDVYAQISVDDGIFVVTSCYGHKYAESAQIESIGGYYLR